MIRSLFANNSFVHTEPIQKQYKILKLQDMYKERVLVTFHKIKWLQGPEILQEIFSWKKDNSRHSHEIKTLKYT